MSGASLLVAGKGRGTTTVLEVWDFTWPTIPSQPDYDPENGAMTYPLVMPTHEATTRVLHIDVPGKQLIRYALGLQGTLSGQYDIDLATEQLTLLASATTSTGSLGAVGELATMHDYAWRANHADHGYIYVFGYEDNVAPTDPPTLVLHDLDRNGAIESYTLIPPGEWAAGWDDDSKYIWP